MNKEIAEELTQSLGQIVAGSYRQIAAFRDAGVPKALGFKTTEEWVQQRLGGYVRMSIPDRREAVEELDAEGYNNVAIAEVLGVDEKTVRNDKRSENSEPNGKNTNENNVQEDTVSENSDLEFQQEREEAAAERNKQETLFRLSEAAYRGTVAWSVDDFASEVRERLADKSFRKQFQDRLRIDGSNIAGIQSGAKVLADVLTQLLKKGS